MEKELKLAICDDDFLFRKKLSRILQDFYSARKIITSVASYSRGEELLNDSSTSTPDILFLDIDLQSTNGIDIAKELRAKNNKCLIIFISGLLEFAPQGYSVNAFRYILKNQLDQVIKDCLEDCLLELGINRVKVEFDFVGGKRTIYTDTIVRISSCEHKLTFHLTNTQISERYMYQKLDIIQEMLPAKDFIRPHKSHLVNLRYIDDLTGKTVFLLNKDQVHMSNIYAPTARRAYLRYKGLIT